MNKLPLTAIFGGNFQWQTRIKQCQQSWHYDPAVHFGKSSTDNVSAKTNKKCFNRADLNQLNGNQRKAPASTLNAKWGRSKRDGGDERFEGERRKPDKAEVKAVEACKSLQNHFQSRPNREGPFLQLGKFRRHIKKESAKKRQLEKRSAIDRFNPQQLSVKEG